MTVPKNVDADDAAATWVRGNDRVRRMLAKPGMLDAVKATRAGMRDADRAHAMGMAALRRAADLTQQDLAASLGITQAAVAKTEARQDLLLSTLSSYMEAIGGHVRVIVTFDEGNDIELDLPALRSESRPA